MPAIAKSSSNTFSMAYNVLWCIIGPSNSSMHRHALNQRVPQARRRAALASVRGFTDLPTSAVGVSVLT